MNALITAFCFVFGFFTAIAMAMLWTAPVWGDDPHLTPRWVFTLADWGRPRIPSVFKRPPLPHSEQELLALTNREIDARATARQIQHDLTDDEWLEEIHPYEPRHAERAS